MRSRTSCLVRISSGWSGSSRKPWHQTQLDYYRQGVFSFDPVLTDLDARWRKIEPYGDYAQVLVLAVPPLEEAGPPEVSAEFARIANDEMAELVQRFPDRFAGSAAALPLSDVELALRELDRALTQLGALGAQLHTNVLGLALDDPRFEPLFTRLEDAGRAVWLHPTRSAAWADYPAESRSDFGLWWSLGWPYETAAALARLVYSGQHGASPAPARDRAPRWRHGAALLRPTRDGPRLSAGQGPTSAAAARLLPEVPRRHSAVRRATRGSLRPRVLRPAARALRHRHASWTFELGRGDDSGHRLGRSYQRGYGCGLLWERRAPARGAFRLTATSIVSGWPVLPNSIWSRTTQTRVARGPPGSPPALSAPITFAAVERRAHIVEPCVNRCHSSVMWNVVHSLIALILSMEYQPTSQRSRFQRGCML